MTFWFWPLYPMRNGVRSRAIVIMMKKTISAVPTLEPFLNSMREFLQKFPGSQGKILNNFNLWAFDESNLPEIED